MRIGIFRLNRTDCIKTAQLKLVVHDFESTSVGCLKSINSQGCVTKYFGVNFEFRNLVGRYITIKNLDLFICNFNSLPLLFLAYYIAYLNIISSYFVFFFVK